jgi:type IV secretory pathway VirB3-like protein
MVRESTLFLALTRPALTWGVPLEALVLNGVCTFYGGAFLQAPVWYRNPLVFWAAGVPIHMVLRELTALDYHWARTFRLRALTTMLSVLTSVPTKPARFLSEVGSSV